MKRTPWNIVFHELLGLEACILSYPDPSLRGICGRVVEETEKTLALHTGGRTVRIMKSNALLLVRSGSLSLVLRGEEILGDPAERVKRLEKYRGVRWLVRKGKERRYPWSESPREDM